MQTHRRVGHPARENRDSRPNPHHKHTLRRYDKLPPSRRPHGIPLDITKDIQPLTTFRNNSAKMMPLHKKTGRPIILTVNGKPEAVVQDAAAYQRLLDIAAEADVNEAIRQGLEDLREGRTRPMNEVFEEMRQQTWHTALMSRRAPRKTWTIIYHYIQAEQSGQAAIWFNGLHESLAGGPAFQSTLIVRVPHSSRTLRMDSGM